MEHCPTNLDPNYDQPLEPGYYRCYCCGAYREHLTTLCPRNQKPESLTQQRIRAGVITGEPSTSLGLDKNRPAYCNPRKRDREPSVDAKVTHTYEDHLASMKLDDDLHMNPERRALLQRTRRSPQSDTKAESNRGNHPSLPPAKRSRNWGDGYQDRLGGWGRRKSQKSQMPRGQSPSIGSEFGDSTELLPQVMHHSNDRTGRLSPWDDSYGDFKMSQLESFPCRRPSASDFWRADSPDTTIQLLFPSADATWVSDVASFDLNRFLDELDTFMENRAVAQDFEETRAIHDLSLGGSGVTMEVDEGEGQTHAADFPRLDYDDLGMYTEFH